MKGKEKIVIQAKRYGVKIWVSLSAVQEVYGAKAYYKANQAWVVTNSYFTKQAKELAAACDVTLVDRADLQKFINEVKPVFKDGKSLKISHQNLVNVRNVGRI